MNRVFVDMDGVIVDFAGYKRKWDMTSEQVKRAQGSYRAMSPIPGAIEAVRELIALGFEVWIATKPPTGEVHVYSEKAGWIMWHLPELERRIIITHDKGLLGDERDFLCDDRPDKANCRQFRGTFFQFINGYHWADALPCFRRLAEERKLIPV